MKTLRSPEHGTEPESEQSQDTTSCKYWYRIRGRSNQKPSLPHLNTPRHLVQVQKRNPVKNFVRVSKMNEPDPRELNADSLQTLSTFDRPQDRQAAQHSNIAHALPPLPLPNSPTATREDKFLSSASNSAAASNSSHPALFPAPRPSTIAVLYN